MILLDTNVLSEAMKPAPDPAVLFWLDAQIAEDLFLASITLAELKFGVAAMPAGRRKESLAAVLDGLLALTRGRVLAFDAAAADRYAEIAVRARSVGRTLLLADGYIAAIASTHGFAVATRDAGPFLAAGLETFDPWSMRP